MTENDTVSDLHYRAEKTKDKKLEPVTYQSCWSFLQIGILRLLRFFFFFLNQQQCEFRLFLPRLCHGNNLAPCLTFNDLI